MVTGETGGERGERGGRWRRFLRLAVSLLAALLALGLLLLFVTAALSIASYLGTRSLARRQADSLMTGVRHETEVRLDRVFELVTVRPEELDTVVLDSVVRSGDHDARGGAGGSGADRRCSGSLLQRACPPVPTGPAPCG